MRLSSTIAACAGVLILSGCASTPLIPPAITWPTEDISLEPVPDKPGYLFISLDDFDNLYGKWKSGEKEILILKAKNQALIALLIQYGIEIPAE